MHKPTYNIFQYLGELTNKEFILSPLMDNDGLVTERWQPPGLPATYFVDPHGKLQYLALGGRPWDTPDYLNFLRNITKQ